MDRKQISQRTSIFLRKAMDAIRRITLFLSSVKLGYQIGLVFYDHSIHLSLVRRFFFRSHLVETRTYALDESAINDWEARVDAAVSILIDFMRERKIRRAPINIGLLNEETAFRRLYLPVMSSGELHAAIRWEGEKLFPFDFDHSIVASSIVPSSLNSPTDQFAINITAVKDSLVKTIYDRFEAARLSIGQIGFLPSMLVATAPYFGKQFSTGNFLQLYLDNQHSMALFTQKGELEFFQQFVTRPVEAIEGHGRLENREAITAELISFIDLYNGHSRGNAPDGIIVCGPYSQDSATVETIGARTGLLCQAMEFHPRILHDKAGSTLTAELAVIAAGLVNPEHHILIPKEIKQIRERRAFALRAGMVAVLSLLITASVHYRLTGRLATGEALLAAKEKITESYERSPGYRAYVNLTGKVQTGKQYLSATSNEPRSVFHVVLKEVSRSVPDYVTLTAINLEKRDSGHELILEGYVRIDEFSPEIVLAEYVEALGALPFFSNVAVSHHQKRHDGNQDDLTFQLKMDAQV